MRLSAASQLSQVRFAIALAGGVAFASLISLTSWQELLPDAPRAALVLSVVALVLAVGSSLIRTRASLGVHRWAVSTILAAVVCAIVGWSAAIERPGGELAVTALLASGVLAYLGAIMVGGRRPYDGAKRMEGIAIAAALCMILLMIFGLGDRLAGRDVLELVTQSMGLMVLSASIALVIIQGWKPSPGTALMVLGSLVYLVGLFLELDGPPGVPTIVTGAVGFAILLAGVAIGDDGMPARDRGRISNTLVLVCAGISVYVLLSHAAGHRGDLVTDICALIVLVGLLGRSTAANAGPVLTDPSEVGGIDRLTGLPDRYELESVLARELEYADHRKIPVAVAVLVLTNLHEINETLGHRVGDEVLREFAGRLSSSCGTDIPVRLAGNTFALVLRSHVTERAARQSLETLTTRLEAPLQVDGVSLGTQVRVGLVFYPAHGRNVAELLQRAEIASQEAKEKNVALLIYDPARDLRSRERLMFATQLREGIERDELRVFFQPKVDLATNICVGAEALVRWQHPTEGLLTPDRFLPVAEKTGQMGQLTKWVLSASLHEARRWKLEGFRLHVAVNLSLPNLIDAALPTRLGLLLERHSLDGSELELEITEDMAMADPARTAEVIASIRKLGINFSLDDFGTGYSSLAHLKHLHCNEIKIDRSFVRDITTSEDDRVIVWSILDLARNLGMRSVAEGIESEDVAEMLGVMGCGMGQGYHYARPLNNDAFLAWCVERQRLGLIRTHGGGRHPNPDPHPGLSAPPTPA